MMKPGKELIIKYHNETKHSRYQHARSPGFMDWENQPVPFRFYKDTVKTKLPLSRSKNNVPFESIYRKGSIQSKPFSVESMGYFLEMSLGLSTWKKHENSTWPLRINPSSGNLHPEESYFLIPDILKDNNSPSLCIAHYNPYLHELEMIAESKTDNSDIINEIDGFGIIIRTIPWRESWKYGERAFRYCCLDTGHAISALTYSALLSGWEIELIPEISDRMCDRLVQVGKTEIPKTEVEISDCFLWVSKKGINHHNVKKFINETKFHYIKPKPNRLSNNHTHWEIIYETILASEYPGENLNKKNMMLSHGDTGRSEMTAEHVLKKRRSARNYDINTSKMDITIFLNILKKLLPGNGHPFNTLPYEPNIHPIIFIHDVEDLPCGLYCLLRNLSHLNDLKNSLSKDFVWQQVFDDLPFFLLNQGNYRNTGENICCNQSIAGNSTFSLGMLSRFNDIVSKKTWMYKRLFWEAGMIGQTLYLEAEAHNYRGTGIGCYYDDEMHDLLGLKNNRWQDLYHFTVGKHKEDTRIMSLPAYYHL